jgi:hypothetical protein
MSPSRPACAAALAAALVVLPTSPRAETPDWGRFDAPHADAAKVSPASAANSSPAPASKSSSASPLKPSPRRAAASRRSPGRASSLAPARLDGARSTAATRARDGAHEARAGAGDAGQDAAAAAAADRSVDGRRREPSAIDGRAAARPLSQTASPLLRPRPRPLAAAPAPAVADWARGRIAGAPTAPPAAPLVAPPAGPASAPPAARPLPEGGPCEAEIARAARRWGVPTGVLHAVGLTETGRGGVLSPYALNIDGVTVFPPSAEAALRRFEQARADGAKFVDMGCMQINHRFHAAAFPSTAAMLEPARNVDYAARFLKQLRDRHGGWTLAVARYNAGPDNDPAQKRYVCAVLGQLVRSGHGAWTDSARAFCGKPR